MVKRLLACLLCLMLCMSCLSFAFAEKTYDEHLTITFATVQTTEGVDYTAGDPLARYFTEKFNFSWDIIPMTFDNWAERMRVWINSGDMPDVCVWNYNHTEAMNYVDQELVKRLPDDWKERWPNAAIAHNYSKVGPAVEEMVDGTYFLMRPRFSTHTPTDPLANHAALYIRKDWAEAVGFEIKDAYKTSEIVEYARLIAEKDPGNVGASLRSFSSRSEWMCRLFLEKNFGYWDKFYFDKEAGEYKWGAASPEILEALKLFQDAYRSGAIDPEFFTLKNIEDYDNFLIAGVSGGFFGENTTGQLHDNNNKFEQNTGIKASEGIHHAIVLGEDGYNHADETINFWGSVIFSPDIDDEVFERYMDFTDYCASEEGQNYIRLGFEGIDYDYDENGNIYSLLPENVYLNEKYQSIHPVYGNNLTLSDDFALINPGIPQAIRDESYKLYRLMEEMGKEDTFTHTDYNVYFHSTKNMTRATYDYITEYTNLVTMDGDLETNWKKWVESQSAVVQPVLDELNAKIGK